MLTSLKGRERRQFKSILITGASSGIGAELSRQYAEPGVRLVLTARRTAKLEVVRKECEAKGATVEVCSVDVNDEAAMKTAITKADDKQPLDLVIANAGLHPVTLLASVDHLLAETTTPVTSANVMGVAHTICPIVARRHQCRPT